jgi:hypothetical protein
MNKLIYGKKINQHIHGIMIPAPTETSNHTISHIVRRSDFTLGGFRPARLGLDISSNWVVSYFPRFTCVFFTSR